MSIRGVAHRGYPKRYPENTLVSFQAAVELSYSHLELDVQLSKDGVPVVIHDTSVDRMTDGKGRVNELTLAELKELRIAGTEPIPTLEEALLLLKDRLIVDIELKQMGSLYPGLEREVLNTVKRLDMREQTFLTSFDHYALSRVRELDDRIGLGVINSGASPALFPFMKEIRCRYISVHHPYISDEFLQICRREEAVLIPYTVDRESDMARFSRYPELLICTNELEKWAAFAQGGS
ncbi:Glycerophosphodiester phosphodiesterase [Paenibacillus solanacearum]|uniref:Glycerophosphodiester phosphodiesterase n=1 Tax=Paenibacillus solanacearum TaxID=2048548 RepID=A0A916K1E5_9BACL|nr:glycerophosphodiester phosphodiesterase family protein [Paenibacillus solanacearum]CAG7626415.1 Glycerophosphodiester phosphodiesterase [Paenibacillus solanacearum]